MKSSIIIFFTILYTSVNAQELQKINCLKNLVSVNGYLIRAIDKKVIKQQLKSQKRRKNGKPFKVFIDNPNDHYYFIIDNSVVPIESIISEKSNQIYLPCFNRFKHVFQLHFCIDSIDCSSDKLFSNKIYKSKGNNRRVYQIAHIEGTWIRFLADGKAIGNLLFDRTRDLQNQFDEFDFFLLEDYKSVQTPEDVIRAFDLVYWRELKSIWE
ncbi:MAG TPA: hypothetical protein PLV21_00040 [Cyclobacteriaceae bacterium]|nr:hypothetical protein [Cyclobacteriaceae bacterium]HRJ80239.1 hypothetical protein [Cyclobacteriaceae bacterium]